MIDVQDLTFDYPETRALDRVSFRIPEQSITALVGPNGAGKTTLLRCLAALEEPVAGTIRVAGADILADPRACHRRLGYLSDSFGLYDELSVRQCLTHAAAAHGLPDAEQSAAAVRAAARLGLGGRLESRAGTLSRGLRQRLAIAQAIVHQPQFLLLDEPASGLDPEARQALADLFLALRADGMTLVVSSHILAELEAYATDLLVLRDGRLHLQQALRPGHGGSLRLRLELTEAVCSWESVLAGVPGLTEVQVDGRFATVRCAADPAARQRLLQELLQRGLPLCAFGEEPRNLQHAYLDSLRGAPPERISP